MFVRKSTYDALLARASITGRALNEMTGELIEGMQTMGYRPDGGPEDVTTAGKVILALRGVSTDRDRLTEDVASLRIALAAANAKLQPFLDRRERDRATLAEHNERRHREALQRAAVRSGDGGGGCIAPKPNGAAVQGAVS